MTDNSARLVGVYEANGSLLGELQYLVGKIRGVRHCALCDITHGTLRKKPAFAALDQRLPIPIVLLHLDERSAEQQSASDGRTPCVMLEDQAGIRVILDADTLDACRGDVERFEQALLRALDQRGVGR